MRLLEWQGREILARMGIPIPEGELVRTPEEARAVATRLESPVVLKAQVLVGGRGKAGGIRLANDPAEAENVAREMLGAAVKGERINELLVVEAKRSRTEHYLGITIDRRSRAGVLIYSPMGGVDIEDVARTQPAAVRQEAIPPLEGVAQFRLRRALSLAPAALRQPLGEIAQRLYRAFVHYEAQLIEINPLAETEAGLIALDAKVIIDDDHRPEEKESLFSGEQFQSLVEATQERQSLLSEDPLEAEAQAAGLRYVRLDGDIGIIGNGAGLVMATLDLVAQAGGRPANFLDIGGGARSDRVKRAVEIVTRDGKAKALFVNVFGGITRCDEVARGILAATAGLPIPVVVRLVGTNEDLGRKILSENGLGRKDGSFLRPVTTMEEGATQAVALVRGR